MIMNRKCNYCGNEYYICRSCIRKGNAWKNVCCSRECFIELSKTTDIVEPIKLTEEKHMAKVLFRGQLLNGSTVDVIGCDLDLGRFDCTDGKTYCFDDFKVVYVSGAELKEMIGTTKHQTETKTKAISTKNKKSRDTDNGSQMPSDGFNIIEGNVVVESI